MAKDKNIILRTAAVWGTSVLSVQELAGGESLELGAGTTAKPENTQCAEVPIRAVGSGWELDARGATGGLLLLRGREEDPVHLGATGAPIPIVSGDHGIIQYGSFGIFFQFSPGAAAPKRSWWGAFLALPWVFMLAWMFSAFGIIGGLLLLRTLQTPRAIDKPAELISRYELAAMLNMKEEDLEPPPSEKQGEDDKGQGIKDPGAKDKKDQGGGKKMANKEGALGRNGDQKQTKMPGEIRNGLGGMSEVLSGEVGKEVRETLGTIGSVASALGGLNSSDIQLGRGPGVGLKGDGKGGGGDGPGVPFGSGTLDTGWGPGSGGGYGKGSGGPGGRGRGGNGRGGSGKGSGSGSGNGTGTGEKTVTGGGDKKRSGQGLTPAQIQRVVSSRYGAFRACYESAAARNPTLKGGVTVSWTITPGGSVTGASIGGSSLRNPRAEGCILRQVRRLRFPQADKPTGASFPFSFRPRKKK